MTSTYVPETFPHRWLPGEGRAEDLGADRALVPEAAGDRRSTRPSELETLALAVGELNAAVGQEGVERYIAMTCQTDDPEREAAYLAFVRDIEPKLKPLQNEIRNRYLDSPAPRRACRATATTSSTAPRRTAAPSTARPTSRARPSWPSWSSSTRRSIGAMTVDVPGQGADARPRWPRSWRRPTARVRQEAWELVAEPPARRPRDARRPVRPDDRAPRSRSPARRASTTTSTTPSASASGSTTASADAIRFHEAIEKVVVPLARQIQEERRSALGRRAAPPLGPGGRSARAGRRCGRSTTSRSWPRGPRRSSARSTPSSAPQFAYLRDARPARPGQPQGEGPRRLPDDARGRPAAVHLHERRRASTATSGPCSTKGATPSTRWPAAGEPLAAYRESPIEFCEVASMTMELLGATGPRPVLRRGRRRPLVPQAARRDRPDPPLDRHGRRLPALDLHPPGPHPRRAPRRLERR